MKTRLLILSLAVLALPLFADNTLTPDEQAGGWRLLFDGVSLKGWRPYGNPGAGPEAIAAGWKIEEGLLKKLGGVKGGDIITQQTFDNFELTWEWRLAAGANNGVKYMVTEARPRAPGYEYQMLDDESDRWKGIPAKEKTGSFYAVLAPAADKPLKPAGTWNASRIIVRGNQVEHWLNGSKVLAFELGSPAVKAGVADSKFKKFADFGTKLTGHIMLTDHQDEAWYRNLKLHPLAAP